MKSKLLMSVVTLALATSGGRVAYGASFAEPEADKVDVGEGFNVADGSKRVSCLKQTVADKDPNQYQSVTFDLSRVSSVEEMQKVLRISASAKFGGGLWSAAGSASYMSSKNYRSNTVNFSVRVHVLNETSKIRKPEFDSKVPVNDPVKFFKRCGDGYVSSVQTGGEFIALFHYEASSEDEANRFAAAISAKSASGAVSADIESALKQFKASERLSIQIIRKGPVGKIPELTIDAITDYAKKFPPLVATQGGHPYPISFTVTPYTAMGIDPPDVDSASRDFTITRMGQYFDAATQKFDALQYVLAHSSEYSFVNKQKEIEGLKKERVALAAFTDKLKSDAKSCMDLQKPCSLAMLGEVPEIHPPNTLANAGGCTQWSADDTRCLQCRYSASQLGVRSINEGGRGLEALCRNMPPKTNVNLKAEGTVGCGFTNEFGNHCGDSNGAVDWWIIVHLGWELGANGSTRGSESFTKANIKSSTYPIVINGIAKTPDDGLVHTYFSPQHVQMWPNAHGPLTLSGDFSVTMQADQLVPLGGEKQVTAVH